MEDRVRWRSTRIDLYRDEGLFRVVRLLHVRTGRRVVTEEVTPEAFAGEREGGFIEAFGIARTVSGGGEMVQVRLFRSVRRLPRRMVNTYRVELPNPALQQERQR